LICTGIYCLANQFKEHDGYAGAFQSISVLEM